MWICDDDNIMNIFPFHEKFYLARDLPLAEQEIKFPTNPNL